MTVEEAKQYLRDNVEKGVNCLCCGRLVKKYHRKITSSAVRALINIYKLCYSEPGFYHLKDFMIGVADTGSNDFNKLKFYDFIERKELTEKEVEQGKKKSSGYYTITNKGKDFVEGKITIPSHIAVCLGKFLGFEGSHITINEALGNHFNYRELMRGYDFNANPSR